MSIRFEKQQIFILRRTGQSYTRWRGFLLPELAASTKSYTKTSLISGLIWAVWHYPLLIWGNYNSDAPRWYSLVTFTIGVMSISFVFTWFRLKSNSLWTGVMLHASHNLFIQAFFDPITIENTHTKYFTGEFGLVLRIISLGAKFADPRT